MLAKIFPKVFDNRRRGHWLALILLAPIALVKLAMGVNSVINTRFVAETVDGIPLEKYAGGGADAVLSFFAVWGLGQILLASQGFVALIRYRAMVPFVYLLMILEQTGRKAIFMARPIFDFSGPALEAGRVSPITINLILLSALFVGFLLSLYGKSDPANN